MNIKRSMLSVLIIMLVMVISGCGKNNSDDTPTTPAVTTTVITSGTGTIKAIPAGTQDYKIHNIDTNSYTTGGTLKVEIVLGSGLCSGSFDLFSQGATIPTSGTANSLAHSYDVAPGATTTVTYTFTQGQIFQFGATGNWYSTTGTTNTYSFTAKVTK